MWSIPKRVVKHRFQLPPDGVAVVARMDEHVRGKRREARADLPHVQVVDRRYVRVVDERLSDLVHAHPFGRDLEQDPPRVLEEAESGPDHEHGDEQGDDRVCAIESGQEDHDAGDRRPDEGVQVGDDVLEASFDRHVLPVRFRELERRSEVDDDADQGNDQHRPAVNVRRR